MSNKKITVLDVAKKANVSKTTVSFYLNKKFDHMTDETKNRIKEAIKELNYNYELPKKNIKTKTSTHRTIGIILRDLAIPFSQHFLDGVINYANSNDYEIIVGQSGLDPHKETQLLQNMLDYGVNGFIVQASDDFETIYKEKRINKKIVFIDNTSKISRGCWVKSDYYGAVHDALNLMLERGYTNYIIVTANVDELSSRQERLSGLTDNLQLLELPYKIITADKQTNVAELHSKLSLTIDLSQPTCIFVCNDWLLANVFEAIEPFKKEIPQNLGLIGFDCIEWTPITSPSITTIIQPSFEEGELSCKILIDQINKTNNEIPNRILKFVFRELESTLRKNKT